MGMVRRRTRRRTMLLAGGMAYERGRMAGESDAYAAGSYAEPAPPPPAPPAPAPTAGGPVSELERLAALHDSGVLSDAEFQAAKQQVLGG